jgi:hypothetical protein
MTVTLSGVTNAQMTTITVSNVTDSFAQVLPDTSVTVGFLLGDVNGNLTVNATDIGQTKVQSGLPVDGTNFRTDVNANGAITASDIGQVKAQSGTFIPVPPQAESR